MNKNAIRNVVLRMIPLVLIGAVLFGSALQGTGIAQSYAASYIDRLDQIYSDYTKFFDSSVIYKLPDTVKADDDISVIVALDEEDMLGAYNSSDKSMTFSEFAVSGNNAKKAEKAMLARKAQILKSLEKAGVNYTVGQEYFTVLSGFEITIKARDFETTCKSLGSGARAIVGEVYRPCETELVENTVNVYDTGIFDSSNVSYDGSGMVVAVLDTGLDYSHSAFSTENFTSSKLGLTYSQVAALVDKTTARELLGNLTVDDVYISEKVPFGFDYADNDSDVYSTHNNHGTHVSGVIVGKDDTITGVAPNAQLVSMKIFSDVYDSAKASWILSALEDCVVLGVDVINMSIGTACGFSRETDEDAMNGVYDRIRAAGISMVVAASNSYSSSYGSEANGNLGLTSNPDTATVGSPSTYKGALSVASINGVETPYILWNDTIVYFNEANTASGIERDFVDTLLTDKDSAEMDYVVIPGVGRSADYTGLDVTGKIVLVRRGQNTFEEKAIIAQEQGAAGIIIYNNVSGDIKMNIGDAKLAICSISQDDGEKLAAAGNGKIKISKSQSSGPFISDFSSWGPSPSLDIKPEITAHGGNILSAVTGGTYDRLSGTSMAAPNLSGVVVLLRQYVVENLSHVASDDVAVAATVNKLLMSTADIILNSNGLPYSVRKQGAGLANLLSAVSTKALITTYDADGNAMDKTKITYGDDPSRSGVYEFSFSIDNFSGETLKYTLGSYVMTEGVSDTKTNQGETTVTEEAYILGGATVEIVTVENGIVDGKKITVDGGKSAKISVKITLSDSDKKYLNDSFENGMYVEGFITLDAEGEGNIDLCVPYLAFYGDWTVAPLFDLDYYQTNADELDDSIAFEDKTLPDAYATRPIGGVSEDYVSYLGSYYFLQDPKDMVISANKDYIALSNQDGTVHSLRFVWAGMLRNAQRIEISIINDATGEVVFEKTEYDVRKSYGDGGSIYPANIEIEFDTKDYNLANNTKLTCRLVGYLDWGDGGIDTNKSNVFEFPITVDIEAPTLRDVEFYYEYDKTLKKNRLYAKAAIYDNHHAMSAQLGYVSMGTDDEGNDTPVMNSFEQYMTPIYSQFNDTTYVTFELTDYIYDIKENAINRNTFTLTCYDYAINYASYEIGLPDDYVDFYFDSIDDGLTLSPYEVYDLDPLVYPDTEWSELLEYTTSKSSVIRVVNNKLVATGSGKAILKVRDPQSNKSVSVTVTVLSEGDDGYKKYDKPVADSFTLRGYDTLKAYYMAASSDKKIGDTGDKRFFEGVYSLSMYPSESVRLNYDLDAYFPQDTTVVFETSNESIVKIDQGGTVTAVAEGFASVSVRIMMDDKSTYYSETVSVEVKDPYVQSGATLTHYYGNGGLVSVPERLSLTEIGTFAFSNYEFVMKTEEELLYDDSSISKQWYIGDNTITKVVLPEGVEKINAYAFANLTALEEIVLPSTLEAIEYGAFYGCSSLKKITFSAENNLKIINQHAFEGCDITGALDLPRAYVISDYAFAANMNLKSITLPETLQSIGAYAFAGCKSLSSVTVTAEKVKYGEYVFTGCESLTSFDVNSSVISTGMFYKCESLKTVNIGKDVNAIFEYAFKDTAVDSFNVNESNTAMKSYGQYILSADSATLIAVAATVKDDFELNNSSVVSVGRGALSHCSKIKSVKIPSVTKIYEYAFASTERLSSLTLGELTHIGAYSLSETAITATPAFNRDTTIEKYAFLMSKIKEVTIYDGMTIAEGTFSDCKDLEKVVIGDDVTIGKYAFKLDKDKNFIAEKFTFEGKEYYRYNFTSSLKHLTIGKNAVIEDQAFMNAAALQSITLGENAAIGYMAFYNCEELRVVDLSKVTKLGGYAFSGDVYYACNDSGMQYAAVSSKGQYIYSYHAGMIDKVELDSLTEMGEYCFSYCRELTDVTFGESFTVIPKYAFAGAVKLVNIDLSKMTEIGEYAFIETALKSVDLSSAQKIGDYAFTYCKKLANVKLNKEGTDIGEGSFTYCEILDTVEGLENSKNIGAYAFAYTAITKADLTSAVTIGDHAFLKDKVTKFEVTLGTSLESVGNNPFAMCVLKPFEKTETITFNGVEYPATIYTFAISDSVKVVDGSLYSKVKNGYQLVCYAGTDHSEVRVADGTVRIGALAFAGSDVELVALPYTTISIGHKAFYECNKLTLISFSSYEAPILEEEYDPAYYESYENIPGTGDFGAYTDYEGNDVAITGMGLIPYYMWNATGGQYSNVFYGANFKDYVGRVEDKLVMVRPNNGQNYDSYIFEQYFNIVLDGAAAADKITLAAIAAIDAIPERVTYEDKAIVEAARAAYNKIATTVQQALVTNYAKLVSAEQRIIALTPTDDEPIVGEEKTGNVLTIVLVCVALVVVAAGIAVAVFFIVKNKKNASAVAVAAGNDVADGSADTSSDEAKTEDGTDDDSSQS